MPCAARTARDTQSMTEALNKALEDSGLTQAEFARALGTSPSRLSTYRSGKTIPSATLYLRALRIAASLKQAREQGWMTPAPTQAAIREALRNGDTLWALKMALQARDHLHEMLSEDPDTADAWEAAPGSTGRPEWDTLLAALAAHEFHEHDRPAPDWTDLRLTTDPWTLENPFLGAERTHQETPEWLAARGIFIAERDLTTA